MNAIRVISQTQIINVDPATAVVSVINAGPQGPPGAGSSSGTALNHVQSSPSDEWIINHNFGFYPNVDVFTVGGLSMLGQVVNTTVNQVRIYFSTSVAGSARLT